MRNSRKLSIGEVRRREPKAYAGRAPGAGRPRNPPEPDADLAVFVEGRVRVSGDDAEGFENLGRLRAAAAPFGLVVQALEVRRDDITTVRRDWGTFRVSLEFAEGWIKDYPGITFLEWTEKVFMAGEPMSAPAFTGAKARARIALSRLWRLGSVRKEKNTYGQLTLWPAGAVAKEQKPDAIPATIKIAVDEIVDAAIKKSQRPNAKAISTKAVVLEAIELVWKKRLFYEEKV